MKNIVLITNESKDKSFSVTQEVAQRLTDAGMSVYVSEDSGYKGDKVNTYKALPTETELIIIVGGDGSVIDASKYAIEHDIPILGINLGRVGYLAEVELGNLQLLDRLVSGDYEIKEKMLLNVSINDVEISRLAVNDVVVSHDSHLGIADIRIEDSFKNTVKYRADGVILSTPQGSTAYSLSSGGPIVAHDVESILMTPVSPHTFFNRSVLFNSSEIIRVTNLGESYMKVSIDGRCIGELKTNDSCYVSKSDKKIKMLTFSRNSMFSSLFNKMRILGDMD